MKRGKSKLVSPGPKRIFWGRSLCHRVDELEKRHTSKYRARLSFLQPQTKILRISEFFFAFLRRRNILRQSRACQKLPTQKRILVCRKLSRR